MSSLAYKTMWFGVLMYFPGHLRWFLNFKPSRGFPLPLKRGLQSLTSADLPNVISFPLPLSHSVCFSPTGLLECFGVKLRPASGPSHTLFSLPGMSSLQFDLQPWEVSCDPHPKAFSLGLASITSTCTLPSQHVSTHYFISLVTRSFVFVLCDSPLSPSPFILRFMSREILFFVYPCIPKPIPEAW